MLPQLVCLTKALQNLHIPYSLLDPEGNLIRVELHSKSYLFQRSRTPFNSESVAQICLDKEHTYHILKNVINMPKTIGFLDYQQASEYPQYTYFDSLDKIIEEIEAKFSYPLVVKRNRGALSKNVFLCQFKKELIDALNAIYNRKSLDYDYVALAQYFINTKQEYRVVFFKNELILAYERYTDQQGFKANYWNLPGGCSKYITDSCLLEELKNFVEPIFQHIPAAMVGVDIIRDISGDLFLVELNSGPKFSHFIEFNGEELIIEMYKTIFKKLINTTHYSEAI
ncbi:ATP-grasp domain-containing protein [Spartinivicinus ruber]|uniref:ATP-grasp domain-containing protein n=1 Tax=Spartinivicinus ruber TaxID=2683272 RepID=UPI0013D39D2F|nr:alpha-L-glutamate ligase [Spartinivicinus ruber]